jgi:hypothetical protein
MLSKTDTQLTVSNGVRLEKVAVAQRQQISGLSWKQKINYTVYSRPRLTSIVIETNFPCIHALFIYYPL